MALKVSHTMFSTTLASKTSCTLQSLRGTALPWALATTIDVAFTGY